MLMPPQKPLIESTSISTEQEAELKEWKENLEKQIENAQYVFNIKRSLLLPIIYKVNFRVNSSTYGNEVWSRFVKLIVLLLKVIQLPFSFMNSQMVQYS